MRLALPPAGITDLDRTSPEAQANRLAHQIAKLGFTRTILPAQDQQAVSV